VLASHDVRLDGSRAGYNNLLNWSVQENATPYSCTLERSFDNNLFDPIYSLQTNAASNIKRNYQFSDVAGNLPMAYYRVKINALGKPPIYSNTILIKNETTANALQVFPVPFTDGFTISIFVSEEKIMQLALFSSNGSLLHSRHFVPVKGLNQLHINNLAQLPAGNYFISIIQNKITLKQKILKAY
jgi:hypothetical protein